MVFTDAERAFLDAQILGRLATVDRHGRPQNNPVGFFHRPDAGTIEIGGRDLGRTRKFRNVAATRVAALVVDEVVSTDPWQVRGIEIRGPAEALTDQDPPRPWMSREVIRIHPAQVFSWGLDPNQPELRRREVSPVSRQGPRRRP